MRNILNLMAFVVFATTLFMRSVDPVIPQIAQGLDVAPTTAALLSTGFTLPYALIQPLLGAIADMVSKTRLIILCMLTLGVSTFACGLATNFEMLFALRIIAGIAAGGIFPIALAVTGDHVPVAQRQVAIGKILFAAMTGNLLGASGAGVIGDVLGWRGVFAAALGSRYQLSDRIAVMSRGRLGPALPRDRWTPALLMQEAGGQGAGP